MNSALASLTAQYTDSENEEPRDESEDSEMSQASQVIIPPKPQTPIIKEVEKIKINEEPRELPPKKKKKSSKVRRLVSYQDDTLISDEEEDNAMSDTSSSESESESGSEDEHSSNDSKHGNDYNTRSYNNSATGGANGGNGVVMEIDNDENASSVSVEEKQKLKEADRATKYAHYNFTLPPEPKGKPPTELVEKINNLYDKMKNSNMDMNRLIQDRKDFRNPSIYEKLIHFCDINEFGTNYPPELYDPLKWGPESYYEELARIQKNEMIKRQKERKDIDKIEQATALARKVEEEAKKRKSKWDQPSSAKPVVQPALTTTVTGTKGTVISAFGSLPKKPAA